MLEGTNVKEFDTLLSKDIIFFLGVKGEWNHVFEEKAHVLLSDSNAILNFDLSRRKVIQNKIGNARVKATGINATINKCL